MRIITERNDVLEKIEEMTNKFYQEEWMGKKQSPLFMKLVKEEDDLDVVKKKWPNIINIKKEMKTNMLRVQEDSFLMRTRRKMMVKASFLK